MKRRITSYQDLEKEEQLLQELLKAQKQLVQADIEQLKIQLKPASTALKFFNDVSLPDRRNPLLTEGANTAIDFLLKKFILGNSGWIIKMIVPYFVKNYSSHLITGNKDNIIQKLFSFIGGKNGKAKEAA
jgi:hypothetical protein